MFNPVSMFTRQAVRRFTTSAIRRSAHHDPYDGVPGHNFPFSTKNRHLLLAMFMVYVGSGFSIPFFVVRHQLLKLTSYAAIVSFRIANVGELLDSAKGLSQ